MSSAKPPEKLFALIDCNNFFASCEIVFNPKLRGKPLLILSSNDGCIVSRSKEAKALGLPMGAPLFEHAALVKAKNVITLSSNFSLYSDFSSRVVQTLQSFGYPVDVYSVDEAFLELPLLSEEECRALATAIRERVKAWTGIPCAIGIAPSKTLAKAENEMGKKGDGISIAIDRETITAHLKKLPVGDVWGIGSSTTEFLKGRGITTAYQLREKEDEWIRRHLSVGGLRTAIELRGISCLDELPGRPHALSITCSRSFGKPLADLELLKQAVATFMGKAAEKLRDQGVVAAHVTLFVLHRHFETASLSLPFPTSFTPDLIAATEKILRELFREGTTYKKAGVTLTDLSRENEQQLNFFHETSPRKQVAIETLDAINEKYGKRSLFLAAEGIEQPWRSRSSNRSPEYTTSWDEIPLVKI